MSLEQPVRGTIRTGDIAHMIRILIADDHAIVRAGLKQFIAEEQDMTVAGEATTGAEAVAFVRASECDVVLLDIAMPDTSGVDTLRQLKQIKPTLPVLILSGYPEKQYALNLLRTGASGYINKETASEQLVAAIRAVTQGRKYVSPRSLRSWSTTWAAIPISLPTRPFRSASFRSSASSLPGSRSPKLPMSCF